MIIPDLHGVGHGTWTRLNTAASFSGFMQLDKELAQWERLPWSMDPDNTFTNVGMTPQSFWHLYAAPHGDVPSLWTTGIGLSPTQAWKDFFAVRLLEAGIDLQQAQARLDPLSVRIGEQYPDLKGWRAQMMSLRAMLSGDTRAALAPNATAAPSAN